MMAQAKRLGHAVTHWLFVRGVTFGRRWHFCPPCRAQVTWHILGFDDGTWETVPGFEWRAGQPAISTTPRKR